MPVGTDGAIGGATGKRLASDRFDLHPRTRDNNVCLTVSPSGITMRLRHVPVAGCFSLAMALMAGLVAPAAEDEPASSVPQVEAKRVDPKPRKSLKIGSVRCSHILYLGNSITLHGPAPQIGWTGNWGMAASKEENDFVHLLTGKIAEAAGGDPEISVRNIADFERSYDKYDVADGLKGDLAFRPDLVIVAIGENVPALKDAEARDRFHKAVLELLRTLDNAGHPTIIVRSGFWANQAKDEVLEAAAKEVGATFVDIRRLGSDPKMSARSERKIDHDGVASHPGDQGMRAIADSIWKGIEARAAEKHEAPAAGGASK